MASAGADGLRRCVFEGCITASNLDIERRPYHKNCGCALHSGRGDTKASTPCREKMISYPIRRAASESSLVAMTTRKHHHLSPCLSPVMSSPDVFKYPKGGSLDNLKDYC